MTTIRELRIDDMMSVRSLANRCLTRDAITDASLKRITFGDPNFSSGLFVVALEHGEVIGCMLGVRRTKSPREVVEAQSGVGWLKLFLVSENHRRRGIATTMLGELERRFKEAGVEKIRVADFAGWTLFSGIDLMYEEAVAFLLSRGFSKVGEAVDYEVDLLDFHVPRRIPEIRLDGSTVRKANPGEKDKLSGWVKEMFSPFWGFEVSEAFRFDEPKLWIAEKEDRILGFSAYGALEPHWFGPIGVDPDSREKGLGTVLLFNSLSSMRDEGQRMAVIPWTSLLFFYSQVPGVKRIRHYWIMEKRLSPT